MPSSVTSLFWIASVAVVAPLIAGLLPRRLVPEVVFLLGLGMLIGPFALDLAAKDEAIGMLSELGLGMLFLLAGYEIEVSELTGQAGRRALLTWTTCLLLALAVMALIGVTDVVRSEIAVAIALTSTALGTLLPILRDTGIISTPVGAAVLRHGAFGEVGPIVAIAVLLGSRGPVESMLLLAVFAAFTVLLSLRTIRMREGTSRILDLIRLGSETTGQTPVRLVMFLLVTLTLVAEKLQLDVVLAAFAAGFILRLALPSGHDILESKLDGIAFGLLVPVFFVTSGMGVDPAAIGEKPGAFVVILVLIFTVRGGPVFLVSRFMPGRSGSRMSLRDSAGTALFAATGLPIIVAVTTIAVDAGEMHPENASLLIGAGAATVLICPALATMLLTRRTPPVVPRTQSSSDTAAPPA